jgi:hypothetical protein
MLQELIKAGCSLLARQLLLLLLHGLCLHAGQTGITAGPGC